MVAEQRGCSAASLVDALVPLIMEEIVEVIDAVPRERIAKRICEHIVDVDGSQVVEQNTEVPKTACRDRTLQCTVEQILNVPVPEMVKQSAEVPKTISQDRIQQQTLEQIVDTPVPQVVEELAEISKVFSQDRVQQRSVEQTVEIPAISLAGKIVDMRVTQTQEKTRQVTNPQVQHVVNAVEAEMSKIIKETVQRKRPVINEKINQVTKHAEVSQVQVVEKTVGIPQLQTVEQIVETPETKTIQGARTSERSGTAPVRQVSQAGVGEAHPTGVVKPDDPDAKINFLAKEALHGVGGFVFDEHGNRVANELGGRNCVTGEMWKNKPPFSLALNNAISDDIAWQCKHYTGRGVRKLHESGTALAEGYGSARLEGAGFE